MNPNIVLLIVNTLLGGYLYTQTEQSIWGVLTILLFVPTGNLDSKNGNEVMELLTNLNDAGTTVVMVTHSEHDARYAHRVIRMLDGSVVLENVLT